MRNLIYESFMCDYCNESKTRIKKSNGRIGKVKKYCSQECSGRAKDRAMGRSY